MRKFNALYLFKTKRNDISGRLIGITTLVGGGTGPADGTRATTCTPAHALKLMLQSTDDMPLNFGFTGKVHSVVCFSLDFLIIIFPCYEYIQ